MSATVALRKGLAKAFDALAAQFIPGVTVTLLEESATANEFTEIVTIESKRFFEYSNFRKNILLQIADDSSDLTLAIQTATHVSINDEVYIIAQGDTLAPSGTNPVWQLFLERPEHRSQYATL